MLWSHSKPGLSGYMWCQEGCLAACCRKFKSGTWFNGGSEGTARTLGQRPNGVQWFLNIEMCWPDGGCLRRPKGRSSPAGACLRHLQQGAMGL